jgi:hypothetical protein
VPSWDKKYVRKFIISKILAQVDNYDVLDQLREVISTMALYDDKWGSFLKIATKSLQSENDKEVLAGLLGVVGFVQNKECAINDVDFFIDVLDHFIDETEGNLTSIRILLAVC